MTIKPRGSCRDPKLQFIQGINTGGRGIYGPWGGIYWSATTLKMGGLAFTSHPAAIIERHTHDIRHQKGPNWPPQFHLIQESSSPKASCSFKHGGACWIIWALGWFFYLAEIL